MYIDKKNLLALFVSFAISLGLVECGMRVFPVPAFRLVKPSFFGETNWFEYHPKLEYTLRTNYEYVNMVLRDDCSERAVRVVANNEGVRDWEDSYGWRPIVFVGDSFTEGYHIDPEKTFAGLTRFAFRAEVDVRNFGVHNYNSADYLRMGRYVKRQVDPRIIFVGLYIGNDISPYARTFYSPVVTVERLHLWLLEHFYLYGWVAYALERIEPVASAAERSVPEPTIGVSGDELVRQLYGGVAGDCSGHDLEEIAQAYVKQRMGIGKARLYHNPWDMYRLSQATAMVLGDLQDFVGDTRIHVLVFPERLQVKDSEWQWLNRNYPDLYRSRTQILDVLAQALMNRGVAFTNTMPYLDEFSYFLFDGHFNERGHRVIANVVADLLITNYHDVVNQHNPEP